MNDSLERLLTTLVPEPGDDETEAALRSVLRRSRRQVRTRAVVGVAAATATVVGTVALIQRGGDPTSDPVVAGSGDPSGDTGPSDGWPWTTSTTTPPPPLSADAFEAVRAEVMDRTDDADLADSVLGCCQAYEDGGPVQIWLAADAHDVAEELRQLWGAAVEISVGGRIYPTGEPNPFAQRECAIPEVGAAIPGLTGTLELQNGGRVRPGSDLSGTLTLSNDTDQDVTVYDPKSGYVTRLGGDDVVGTTMRAFTLEARLTTVPAGGTAEVAGVVVGTASCQIDGPPGIAPGDYEAIVQVELAVDPVGPGGNPALIVRAPLTVIPRQR